MALEDEITAARKRIYRDGYDMSLGEITSLYERGELVVNPEYQRLFRWDVTRRTRFIESLLLNVPIPPIFVFSGEGGRWELIDGLQRVSTVLEFMGLLRSPEGELRERFVCSGTELLPNLAGKRWPMEGEDQSEDHLTGTQQISVRRQRLRIEILGPETDSEIKFELFQRLNTGGANLSEQEIRNCILISVDQSAYNTLQRMAANDLLLLMTNIGEERRKRQYAAELAVRFVVMRHVAYTTGMDLHEYLDKGSVTLAKDDTFDWPREENIFVKTLAALDAAVGSAAFKKSNRFSLAMFEFVMNGTSKAIERDGQLDSTWLSERIANIEKFEAMEKYSGSGVRGTQRLSGLIPEAQAYFS